MTSYTIELVIWFISFLIQKAFSDFVVEFASVNLQGLFQTSNFPCAEPNANEQSFFCVCVQKYTTCMFRVWENSKFVTDPRGSIIVHRASRLYEMVMDLCL